MGYLVTYLFVGVVYASFNDELKGNYTDRIKKVLVWPVDLYERFTKK